MAKLNSYRDELIAEIRSLAQSQGLNEVFTTFLEITANSIASQMDLINKMERSKRYEEIVREMDKSTLTSYARMFALLVLSVLKNKDAPCDILGSIYHELHLNNEWNGQFFTPDDVCRMMAQMINPVYEEPGRTEPIFINEPACGSGAIVIGTIWAMTKSNFDYERKAFFVAEDIDIRCVWMAYIQLSLYGIPGVVIHGNTLTMEEWSRWYTPYASLSFTEAKNQMKEYNHEKSIHEAGNASH